MAKIDSKASHNIIKRDSADLTPFSIIGDTRLLPPINPGPKQDEAPFKDPDPVVEAPISVDHGLNFKVGNVTFLNSNLLVLNTCLITIGENVLFGPNVCLYGATHPIDPAARRGLKGPEAGKEIHLEDDVWIGGSALILTGVRVGRGSTVGAGSFATKVKKSVGCDQERWANLLQDVPPFHFPW